jgi:hypothetical protein
LALLASFSSDVEATRHACLLLMPPVHCFIAACRRSATSLLLLSFRSSDAVRFFSLHGCLLRLLRLDSRRLPRPCIVWRCCRQVLVL